MSFELEERPETAVEAEFRATYLRRLLDIQDEMRKEPQVELPLLHDFSPGLYMRRIFMPKDTWVIGKTHKTEHFNVVLAGAANVMINGEVRYIKAPTVFKSAAGVKKVLYIIEDMIWTTLHPTDETDLDKLEEMFVYSDEEERQLIAEEVEKLL